MKKTSKARSFYIGWLLLFPVLTHAEDFTEKTKIDQKTTTYSVGINATRVIYNPASSGTTLTVSNTNNYPVLAQTEVLTEDKKSTDKFVITPPLFRLDAGQQSRIRLIMTSPPEAIDRETMYWLCSTGIPPESGDTWDESPGKHTANSAQLDVKVKLKQCIKIFARPASIKEKLDDVAAKIKWERNGKDIRVVNPTPFYLNFRTVMVNGTKIETIEQVPPFGNRTYKFSGDNRTSGNVNWVLINDLGGENKPVVSPLG